MFRVLLVEDEYLEREALKLIISKNLEWVSVVGETGNGSKAIQMCEELKPDIIFMDIKIPGTNGIDAARLIKAKDKDVIIIFRTAYTEEEYLNKCVKAGGDEYIPKPSRPQDIIHVISKYKDKIKNKKSLITDMHRKLSEYIIVKDYKESKKVLGELVDHITLLNPSDIKELKQCCKDTAVEIIKSLEHIELKGKASRLGDEEFFRQILSINDSYSLKS